MADLDLSVLNKKFGNNHGSSSRGKNGSKSQSRDKNQNKGKNQNGDKRSYDNKKQNGKSGHGKEISSYVGAPYNFVPFSKSVVPVKDDDMPVRGIINDKLLSGEITYSVKAEMPIFIDDGTEEHEFYRNVYGNYAIPGSTARGLFRTHAQILGVSGFNDDIEDYRLMYRKVGVRASDPDKKRYDTVLGTGQILVQQGKDSKQISILKHVKGGYIKNINGKYYIYSTEVKQITPSMEEMNYYVLSERYIQARKDDAEFSYFKRHRSILQHDLSEEFVITTDKNGKIHYKGAQNSRYVPGYYKISYKVKNLRHIIAVGEPGEYEKEGYLVFTGKMNEKKAVYVIPKMDETECMQIPEEDVKAFLIDLKKKETTLKTFGGVDKFELPQEGKTRPVFYIRLDGRLYFGYTPRLRLFYDYTMKEGYKQENTDGFDMAKSIFGCIGEGGSFKSKVSFSDIILKTENPEKEKETRVILGEPKPSSYMDYLEQSKDIVTYNQDFVLRGVKQYWLREELVKGGIIKNENVGSVIKGLSAGNIFSGKIRFWNLTKEELGLLLWCVRLEKNSQVNIGKAKSYGYGRCSIFDISARVLNYNKAYGLDNTLDLNPFDQIDIDEYINAYKDAISERLQTKITETEAVKTFFMMKDVTIMPEADKIRYMSINGKEYKNRTEPLQKPESLVKH